VSDRNPLRNRRTALLDTRTDRIYVSDPPDSGGRPDPFSRHAMAFQQVILTTHLPNLGSEADVVKVRAGYARNFLFPRGLAYEVTPASMRKLNTLKTKRAEREAKDLNDAQEQAGKINKIKLTMVLETGATGKAFGSISVRDIEERLAKDFQGLKIDKHMIQLDKPIKETGEHEIPVRLHADVIATFKVIAQSSTEGEEKAGETVADSPKKRPLKRKS
jgi:large subunit ribosomal protein L9